MYSNQQGDRDQRNKSGNASNAESRLEETEREEEGAQHSGIPTDNEAAETSCRATVSSSSFDKSSHPNIVAFPETHAANRESNEPAELHLVTEGMQHIAIEPKISPHDLVPMSPWRKLPYERPSYRWDYYRYVFYSPWPKFHDKSILYMDDLYITSFRPEFPQLTNRDLETTRKKKMDPDFETIQINSNVLLMVLGYVKADRLLEYAAVSRSVKLLVFTPSLWFESHLYFGRDTQRAVRLLIGKVHQHIRKLHVTFGEGRLFWSTLCRPLLQYKFLNTTVLHLDHILGYEVHFGIERTSEFVKSRTIRSLATNFENVEVLKFNSELTQLEHFHVFMRPTDREPLALDDLFSPDVQLVSMDGQAIRHDAPFPTNLKYLNFSAVVTVRTFEAIASNCPKLEALNISVCGDGSLENIIQLSNLRFLSVEDLTSRPYEWLRPIFAEGALPDLQFLRIELGKDWCGKSDHNSCRSLGCGRHIAFKWDDLTATIPPRPLNIAIHKKYRRCYFTVGGSRLHSTSQPCIRIVSMHPEFQHQNGFCCMHDLCFSD